MNGRRVPYAAVLLACLLPVLPSQAQKEKREPLTGAEIEQIRDAGNDPDRRVSLYTKILDEHAATIKGLTSRVPSDARVIRLDGELQDFTALLDELGSNLDVYSDRKADIRKSLKALRDSSQHWLGVLRALAGEPGFDLSRKEAIESAEELADDATRMDNEQTAYFNLHKDERGQDRAEPK